MAPAGSFDCNCEMAASTFNYVNCALQNAELNGGTWLDLEKRTFRGVTAEGNVSVIIRVEFKSTSEINGARIPSGFYKTLIINGIRGILPLIIIPLLQPIRLPTVSKLLFEKTGSRD